MLHTDMTKINFSSNPADILRDIVAPSTGSPEDVYINEMRDFLESYELNSKHITQLIFPKKSTVVKISVYRQSDGGSSFLTKVLADKFIDIDRKSVV